MAPLTDSDGTMRTDLLARFLLAINERDGSPIAEKMKKSTPTYREAMRTRGALPGGKWH